MLIYHDIPTLYSNLQCGGRRYVTGSCGFKFLMMNSEWEDPIIARNSFLNNNIYPDSGRAVMTFQNGGD